MRLPSWVYLGLVVVTPLCAQTGINISWEPITDAERAQKTPSVEKDAGVEALFWRVHILDAMLGGEEPQRIYYNYVRLKVFDEKGKSQVSTIDLRYDDKATIDAIAGRTIKADGTEVELKKESIYTRDLARAGGKTVRVKSFAMPAVEPGAIVEYRWKETRSNPRTFYTRLQFQREYPVQKVTYFVKPLSRDYTSYTMSIWPFHCQPSPPKEERNGFSSVSLENVPAFHEEPMMPGEPNIRLWALIFYRDGKKREPAKYWSERGKELYNQELKPALHANDEVKQAAHKAIEGADTDEKKMLALVRYIRAHVRDLYGSDVSAADRLKIIKSMPKERLRTAAEVFKSGVADSTEINSLAVAMASQAGLEARPALVGDRDDLAFDPALADDYFLENVDTAVKVGGNWKLYDITQRRLPAGMLSSSEEGMQSLIGDPKEPFFVNAPVAAPELSRDTRTGKFKLSEDGVLEGDAEESLTGHEADARRTSLTGDSEALRIDGEKERITKLFPGAELSNLKIVDFDNAESPLRISYHIKIEGYGQRTGKRLLFEPLYFERGGTPLFTSAERRYPVAFPHAWSEYDEITIALPKGFSLDNAQNLPALNFGKPGSFVVLFGLTKENELVAKREFVFGKEEMIAFPKESYPQLKKIFEEVHNRDSQTISLKPDAAEAK